MALTISTGFVVDDAIVMIENIMRYIEEGEAPLEAALKGSEQIGFTILSLTVSLIAVLIPLLFMGDIVGRLFREFAVTLSVTILVSAVVSLTLTPMMCAKLLRHKRRGGSQTGSIAPPSACSNRSSRSTAGPCSGCCGIRPRRWSSRSATLASTILLYLVIPKGFFPVQDTGVILGISEAAADDLVPGDGGAAAGARTSHRQDPAVESLSSFIGIDGTNTTLNSGRIQINLKPLEERRLSARATSSGGCSRSSRRSKASRCSCSRCRT